MSKTKTKTANVHVFKVALMGAKDIWRRIAIRGDQTLDDLHEAIYDAFDRDDPHLYSFYVPSAASRGRNRLGSGAEYTHPFNAEDPGPFRDKPLKNAAKTAIQALGLQKGQRLGYLFDFGDMWRHELTVELVDGEPDRQPYPRILEKHGKSPPQYADVDDEEE